MSKAPEQPHNLHKHGSALGQSYSKLVDYLLQFSSGIELAPRMNFVGTAWLPCPMGEWSQLPANTLVLLKATQDAEFRLSWTMGETRTGGQEILLKSARTGREAWWSNVEINRYPADSTFEEWRWTNAQHDFQKRWAKVVSEHSSIMRAGPTKFVGDEVYLTAMYRYGMSMGLQKVEHHMLRSHANIIAMRVAIKVIQESLDAQRTKGKE